MGLRDRIKRLENQSDLFVSIPQPTGPAAKFPKSQLADAFLTTTRRQCGEDVPPHPLALAAGRSPDPGWSNSLYADDGSPVTPVRDLSE